MSRVVLIAAAAALAAGQATWAAGTVAIVDTDWVGPSLADTWCAFLEENGYECTAIPTAGPEGPLVGFDVVIDMSEEWTDPAGMLSDHMRARKGVILWGPAAYALGVDFDPTVQAWVGANVAWADDMALVTVADDAILGDISIGTILEDSSIGFGESLQDASGHPNAKVLARWGNGAGDIGIMRNTWEGGQSVYFTNYSGPSHPLHADILLNTMDVLMNPVPTVSEWGVVVLVLLMASGGSVVIVPRCPEPRT